MAKRLHGSHAWFCPYCKIRTEQERLDSGEHLCAVCGESFTARESEEAKLKELKNTRTFKVGVFPRAGRRPGALLYSAYTTWYNSEWPGCCEHEVSAVNGTNAKKAAIAEHKSECLGR